MGLVDLVGLFVSFIVLVVFGCCAYVGTSFVWVCLFLIFVCFLLVVMMSALHANEYCWPIIS